MNYKQLAEKLFDPNVRIRSHYKIKTKKQELATFSPNSIQELILKNNSKRKVILKARQFGISTLELIRMLDHACFNHNTTCCILAHDQDGIKKIFSIVRTAYNNMPSGYKPDIDKGGGSLYELRFPDWNSKIYCDLDSRGDTINWLHVSEAAFIKDKQKVFATMQAVPMDGIVTLETTPNGMGNWFYDLWNDDAIDFDKIFYPWYFHNEYQIPIDNIEYTEEELSFIGFVKTKYSIDITKEQISFRRVKQSELKNLFKQEYPEDEASCFLSSGNPAMNLVIVSDILKNIKKPIKEKDGIKIYESKTNETRYVIGADTAEGVGGDYSTASVFDVRNRKQVATLRGQFKPSDFAHKLYELAKMYERSGSQMPLIAVEKNNHGHSVLLELSEHIHYPNLYYHDENKVGWLTDRITRPIMIDSFIDGVENKTIALTDEETLKECLTLINDNGKIQADTGKHDDCVMASAIAIQMCIKAGELDLYENISKRILL